jgi:hypothetical protein
MVQMMEFLKDCAAEIWLLCASGNLHLVIANTKGLPPLTGTSKCALSKVLGESHVKTPV